MTNVNYTSNATVIEFSGRLDTLHSSECEKLIEPVLDSDMRNIIINCKGLTYISSSGLRIFIKLQKAASQKNGKLTIEKMNAGVREVFEMTGLASLFQFA